MQFFIYPQTLSLKSAKSKPVWNGNKSDLDRYRANENDLERRKKFRVSKNCQVAILAYREKLQDMRKNLFPFIKEFEEKFKADQRKLTNRVTKSSNLGHCARYLKESLDKDFSDYSHESQVKDKKKSNQNHRTNMMTAIKNQDEGDISRSHGQITAPFMSKPKGEKDVQTTTKLCTSKPNLTNSSTPQTINNKNIDLFRNIDLECDPFSELTDSCDVDNLDQLLINTNEALMTIKEKINKLDISLGRESSAGMLKGYSTEVSKEFESGVQFCSARPKWLGLASLDIENIREIKNFNPTLLSTIKQDSENNRGESKEGQWSARDPLTPLEGSSKSKKSSCQGSKEECKEDCSSIHVCLLP